VRGPAILACTLLLAGIAAAQTRSAPEYDAAYIGPPLSDPLLQAAKETYVVMGCAYCHGIDLVPRGEAPDLRTSALVRADVDGSRLIPLLKAGVPKTLKLSPMPQYSDLSERQLAQIVRWIHHARQLGTGRKSEG
jgi:mono/diheme cytochrome c family protein